MAYSEDIEDCGYSTDMELRQKAKAVFARH
jgi:hypothetical protein